MGRKATAPEHGVARYAKGECRCDEICRPAWKKYMQEYKARRKGQPKEAHFQGRTERMRISLTPLAFSIMRAHSARENVQFDDVVERALRRYALAS